MYVDILAACHKPFKWHEHEFNPQGHIYVKTAQTVVRLNSLGVPWDLVQHDPTVVNNPTKTKSGKDQYDAVCAVQLRIEGLGSRGATGASTSWDKDNAVKASGSFAFRKAASLFGVAHGLMVNPVEESAFVNHMASADLTDIADVKKAVALVADINGMKPLEWLANGSTNTIVANVDYMLARLKEDGRI